MQNLLPMQICGQVFSALVTALLKNAASTFSFQACPLIRCRKQVYSLPTCSIAMPISAIHACLSAGQILADAKRMDAQPQATQALPHSTSVQMHASCSAEPDTQLTPRLEKLPIYGPRLPDRTRHHKRALKEPTRRSIQPAERANASALLQPPAPDQAKMLAAPGPQSMTPQPASAKRIKLEEGAQSQQPMIPACIAVQSAPVQPLQAFVTGQTKPPASGPPQSQTPPLPQTTFGGAACSQAQLALHGSAVTVGQQPKLLDLFGAGASLDLQQKQDALEALISSVADGM